MPPRKSQRQPAPARSALDIRQEVERRLWRAAFDLDELFREHGDAGPPEGTEAHIRFLWIKATYEALEGIVWYIDPRAETPYGG